MTCTSSEGSDCSGQQPSQITFFDLLPTGSLRLVISRTPDQDFRCFYPCEINRIHHWCSVGTEKSQPEGPPFQWETRLAEFPTERWTRGLGFFWNHWTPMIDSFSHLPRPYGTVLCSICWWRHWDRCKQSMTRVKQINLKQRINSALNNEQMGFSSKWINKN